MSLLYSARQFMSSFKGAAPKLFVDLLRWSLIVRMDGRTCQRDIDGVQAQHVKRSQADEEGKQDKGGYRNL